MTVAATFTRNVGDDDGSVIQFTWTLLTANADGNYFKYPQWADICFTAIGTFGGATLTIEGNNDGGTVWLPLSNAAGGAAATATANKAMTIIERPLYIRPNLTAVGVGASITVIATCRRTQPLKI